MTSTPPVHPAQAVVVAIQLRFADMDAYGHVNNVSVLRLVEEARVRALPGSADWGGLRPLVARQEIEYRAVLGYAAAPTQVRVWASRVGGSSFELSCLVEDQDGQVTAITATTLVVVDETGRPAQIPAELRGMLEEVSGPPAVFRGR